MATIYHVTGTAEWERARSEGSYQAPSLKEEGLIHCCEERQLKDVLERYFKGRNDLVKLVIDTGKLTSQLIYEWSPSVADTFPHIYGPINIDAVVNTEKISPVN